MADYQNKGKSDASFFSLHYTQTTVNVL